MKHRIWFLRIALFITYIAVWFVFGKLYQIQANKSQGQEFAFQSDIQMRTKLDAPKRILKIESNNETTVGAAMMDAEEIFSKFNRKDYGFIAEIVQGEGEFRGELASAIYHFAKHSDSSRGGFCFVHKNKLGDPWGRFYSLLLDTRHIEYFSFTQYDGIKSFNLKNLYKLSFYTRKSDKPNVVKSTNYGIHVIEDDPDANADSAPSIELIVGLADGYSIRKEQCEGRKYHSSFCQEFFSQAYIVLDDVVETFSDITSGDYDFKLMDFLYFSGVTITTLGYGDILPNATNIRVLVMVETLFGLILVGSFISSFFIGTTQKQKTSIPLRPKRKFRPTAPPKRRYRSCTRTLWHSRNSTSGN